MEKNCWVANCSELYYNRLQCLALVMAVINFRVQRKCWMFQTDENFRPHTEYSVGGQPVSYLLR